MNDMKQINLIGKKVKPELTNRGLFSSLKMSWTTPKKIYEMLDQEFNFDFDPCPPNPAFDGLEIKWGLRNFVNPPYGRQVGRWISKGIEEYEKGNTVVFLLASRTDTIWFHKLLRIATEIRFIKGRLKFDDNGGRATFPSAIIILKKLNQNPTRKQKET